MSARVLTAACLLADADTWIEGGGILVARGRVVRLVSTRASLRRAAREAVVVDSGMCVLTPGLVNAHAHLELSGLGGRLARNEPFGAWVARLLELREARGARGLARDARRGAARCLATGTTLVGDVDTTGAAEHSLRRSPLRVRLFREVLDAQQPERTPRAIARARAAFPRAARMRLGLAPHSLYSVSPALLAAVAQTARRRALPVSVHWSETAAELEWLRTGGGALASLLGPSPRASGLELLERAGLLGAGLVLVHGNLPQRGEVRRIAAAGATVVHCPGSHGWFARPPFEIERYLRGGVRLALGSDSMASNDDLDLGREMALLRAAHPGLAPRSVWEMATVAGAHALGHGQEAGALHPGSLADIVAWNVAGRSRQAVLEELTSGGGRVEAVWIAGALVWPRAGD